MTGHGTIGRMRWERVEPVLPCTSPDGHEHVDLMSLASTIPESVVCPRCGEAWTVVLLADDPASA